MVCNHYLIGLGDCGNALGVIGIEYFRLNIEELQNIAYVDRCPWPSHRRCRLEDKPQPHEGHKQKEESI
jgi:hypothetical protein